MYHFAPEYIDLSTGIICVHFVWFLRRQHLGYDPIALYGLTELDYFSKNLCSTKNGRSFKIWHGMRVSK